MFLTLAREKRHAGLNIKEDSFVMTPGQSIDRMHISTMHFPCVMPAWQYLVFTHGKCREATGLELLGLQGVQQAEIAAFGLMSLSDAAMHNLAGNAFTCNVCCIRLGMHFTHVGGSACVGDRVPLARH